MSTQSQVRSAWNSAIWSNATITAITPNIFNYDVLREYQTSVKEYAALKHVQETNFITYIVSRAQRIRIMGQVEQKFSVEIRVYKEADVEGTNFNAVLDTFETIDSLVVSQLGNTWSSTVDFYSLQESAPEVTKVALDGVPVWLGTYTYTGVKNV